MNGADYVALQRISRGATEDETLAEPGQTCERIGPEDLEWLLKGGHIAPVKQPAPPGEDR
jgi:hypothetical protein